MNEIGDETKNATIGRLVRETLCRCLISILSKGLKQSILKTNYLWDVLVQCAKTPSGQTYLIKGITLSSAVNTMLILKKPTQKNANKQFLSDEKCTSLICYLLKYVHVQSNILNSYNILAPMLKTMLEQRDILNKMYDSSALICQTDNQEKIAKFLTMLTPLQFILSVHASF